MTADPTLMDAVNAMTLRPALGGVRLTVPARRVLARYRHYLRFAVSVFAEFTLSLGPALLEALRERYDTLIGEKP